MFGRTGEPVDSALQSLGVRFISPKHKKRGSNTHLWENYLTEKQSQGCHHRASEVKSSDTTEVKGFFLQVY